MKVIFLILFIFSYLYSVFMQLFCFSKSIPIDYINYFCILLCFLIALTSYKSYITKKDFLLLILGLFLTLLADFCLIFLGFFAIGMVLFSLVQITYALRYRPISNYATLLRFLLFFLVLVILDFCLKLPCLFIIAIFYVTCLITSVFRAQKNNFPVPNKYMISVGMLLFLLCDINVAIKNLPLIITLPNSYTNLTYSASTFLIFFFYLPSQLLLSLSGAKFTSPLEL